MDRRARLLQGLDLPRLLGAEIGPLDKPLIRRSDGPVLYVDHADTAALRAKNADNPNVNCDDIVEVDAIWGQHTLAEALGAGRRVDYVLRRESTLSDVLEALMVRARRPLPRVILDHLENDADVEPAEAWSVEIDRTQLKRRHSPFAAMDRARHIIEADDYHDVHCWVFTPRSFAELLADAAQAGLVRLECHWLYDTQHGSIEFMLAAGPCADSNLAAASWRRVMRETSDGFTNAARSQALHDRAAAAQHLAEVEDALASATRRLTAIEASISWRITAPLRRVTRILRRQ